VDTSVELGVVLVKIGDDSFGDQIPDLNSRFSCGAQPVSVGRESKSVDDVSGIEGVQVLAFVEIPELGSSVLTARSTERTIRGNSDGVDVVSVSREVGAELAVGQVPDLDLLVPATGDNQGIGGVGGETNTADPLAVTLVFDGVLALTEGVPKTDGLIARSRDDLSVVSGESNAQNILGVSNESLGGGSRVEVPETEGVIPRSRESELSIGGDDNILDEVGVSMEGAARNTEVRILSGQGPDNDGLISGGRQDHVRALGSGGDCSNPSSVTPEDTTESRNFGGHR